MKCKLGILLSISSVLILHCNGGELQQSVGQEDDRCSPWFSYSPTTNECECHELESPSMVSTKIVRCTQEGALLRSGYCMTYKTGEGVFVSSCNDFKADDRNTTKDNYIILPENVTELNEYMCAPLNSRGVACSKCLEGFGRAALSPGFRCSNCTNVWYGVPLYLFMEFVPITIFYFLVLLFQINLTTAPMLAYVFYCQIAVSTLLRLQTAFEASFTASFLNIMITFYGFWNLDFFRYILPPFCVSPTLKPIHIISLQYISAFYPLGLIFISWIWIKMYSMNVRPITWLWSRLKKCLSKSTSMSFKAKYTMIDVFATFFLLSYAKLVFTSYRSLSYGIKYNLNNGTLSTIFHVESDPSVAFFSREHLPFVIISISIFLVAVIPITILLAFYPVRVVRSLLFRLCQFSSHTKTTLNIFVEKYYSCLRDGLDGGRDMRSLASLYFFLRLIVNFIFIDQIPLSASYTFVAILYGGSSLLVALLQPYKKAYMNILDSLILGNMAMITVLLDKYSGQDNSNIFGTIYLVIGSVLATLPMLAIIGFVSFKIVKKLFGKKMSPCAKKTICCLKNRDKTADIETGQQQRNSESTDDLDLPDRILHPEEYCTDHESGSPSTATTTI